VQLHIGESRDSGSALRASRNAGGKLSVIASIAKQSIGPHAVLWVASCYASRNDGKEFPRVTEKDLHFYEPKNGHGLKHDPFNAIVAPRPIGWISSRDAKEHQPRALQLLQWFLLSPADHRLLLDLLEGQRPEHPGDGRIRLESRHYGSGEADERNRRPRRP
jgi:hypothetical protein